MAGAKKSLDNLELKTTEDIAIVLAWPDTKCKQAGAWYDNFMGKLSINQNGYYKVGHAAIVLIKKESGHCHYFDFGRYHSPVGYGRVRDMETDHDLTLNTRVYFNKEGVPQNLEALLEELDGKVACHGDGDLHTGLSFIDFDKSYQKAKQMQEQDFIPYGPFVQNGTNCSRFVQSTVIAGMPLSFGKMLLKFPVMITPTPKWNVTLTKHKLIDVLGKSIEYETETA